MGLDQKITGYDKNGETIEKWYRKVNWLRNWVIENTSLEHDSNTESVELGREKLRELIQTCDYVLKHKEQAPEKLETLSGFFFGDTEYDEWYFEEVKQVRDDMEELLNDENLESFDYWDWW